MQSLVVYVDLIDIPGLIIILINNNDVDLVRRSIQVLTGAIQMRHMSKSQ